MPNKYNEQILTWMKVKAINMKPQYNITRQPPERVNF